MAEPGPIVKGQLISYLEREMGFVRVLTGPPPTGYADLLVYQYNPDPGPKPEDPQKLSKWEDRKKEYDANYFELPDSIKPISSIRDMLQKVASACFGGKRLRQLRIMGHGNVAQARFGAEQVYLSGLYHHVTKQKTPMAVALEGLKQWLDPNVSVVILDHCLTGKSDEFLKTLSNLWGGVAVRAFTHFQGWEKGEIQVGIGPFQECKGDTCHWGYEYHPDQAAHDPGQ